MVQRILVDDYLRNNVFLLVNYHCLTCVVGGQIRKYSFMMAKPERMC